MNFLGRAFLGVTLCASALSASEAPLHHFERRGETSPASSRVIVEFHGSPAATARGTMSAAQYDQLFARFRADITGDRVSTDSTRPAAPRIAHEYRTVFLGAAVEADEAAVSRIRALAYVRAVHPDRVMRASASPAAAPLSVVVDARTKVNASSLGTGGAGIVVAVIDTGIDYRHPSLGGGLGAGFKVAGGYDFVNDDADPMDDHGHGTHVAATVAGNAPDLIGVAPDVTLIGYKVLGATGSGTTSGIIAAIERATDPNGDGDPADRVHVANLSLGGPGDAEDPTSRAVDNAVAAGVVMVVAAGNEGATASIGSPGTALDAITVAAIDDDGHVTNFSSRGPSPRLLGFKPDVAAPGFQIVSARAGGGTIALNGTSMAAPHVAGVAALLLKLHPSWTPAEVKAAITSTATSVTAAPFARGAGRADARAAHEVKLLVGSSGLSFGIRPSRTGATTATQTFRLTNRSESAQSLALASGTTPAGVVVRVTPATLQLAPGASAEVALEVETANDSVAFPNDAMLGGDVRITGSATASLAWAFLRTGRVRMTFDGTATTFLALGAKGAVGQPMRDPRAAEVFLPPGDRWDFLLVADDARTGEQRLIVKRNVEIDGDHQLEFRNAEASLEIVVDGRDQTGRSLTARSAEDSRAIHLLGTRMEWSSGNQTFSLLLTDFRSRVSRLLFSSLPENYQLYHYEQFIHFAAGESYTIEHDALSGLTESKSLASGGPQLTEAKVAWRDLHRSDERVTVCAYDALTSRLNVSFSSCFAGPAPATNTFRHHTTDERFPLAHNGMMFGDRYALTQALRGRNGRVVVSSQITPPPTAEQVAPGGTITVGAGPASPFALPGTRDTPWFRVPTAGFQTGAGDMLSAGRGMDWKTFDASGAQTGAGIWFGNEGERTPPAPQPRSKLVATRHDLRASDRLTRGTFEVTFGSDADLTAPTLTSLRVVDSQGRTTDRLTAGESATLQFAVADLDYRRAASSMPTRPEATKAWFRISGTESWQPLTVSITGSESGSAVSLGHVPAGDLYSAALTGATAIDAVRIDLRVEFADPAGNTVRWTHEAAINVGTPAEPTRRRAIRK